MSTRTGATSIEVIIDGGRDVPEVGRVPTVQLECIFRWSKIGNEIVYILSDIFLIQASRDIIRQDCFVKGRATAASQDNRSDCHGEHQTKLHYCPQRTRSPAERIVAQLMAEHKRISIKGRVGAQRRLPLPFSRLHVRGDHGCDIRIDPDQRAQKLMKRVFRDQRVVQHQMIDTGGHEAHHGIVRGLDDRLALHVE